MAVSSPLPKQRYDATLMPASSPGPANSLSNSNRPMKSILKTSSVAPTAPNYKRKRPEDYVDSSDDPSLPDEQGAPANQADDREHTPETSPTGQTLDNTRTTKRRKVTFVTSTPPKSKRLLPEKSPALIREEVRRALQRHFSGDSEGYESIRGIFAADPKRKHLDDDYDEEESDPVPSQETLYNYLCALLANVASLDASCGSLVNSILASEWLGRGDSYFDIYAKFLATLVAARGTFLNPVLRMLTISLRDVPVGISCLPGYAPLDATKIYKRVHAVINYVISLVPAGAAALAPMLATSFPLESDSVKAHVAYTLNLIKIINYAPELRADVLALIIEKLVKLDVQVQIDMAEVEDEDEESEDSKELPTPEALAYSTPEDEIDPDDDVSDVSEDLDPETEQHKRRKENYRKIDYIIDILFSHYRHEFEQENPDNQDDLHDLMLSHFTNIILPTYGSRYSQFLLFHFSQIDDLLVDRFATCCMQIMLDHFEAPMIRQYAAAYLASFISRGAYVPNDLVHDVFLLLGRNLKRLNDSYEESGKITHDQNPSSIPNLRRYAPYYAMAQAMMYIFCFRWRDLTTISLENNVTLTPNTRAKNSNNDKNGNPSRVLELDEVTFPPEIRDYVQSCVLSKLNPLKICDQNIVAEFARISQHLNFVYVHTIIERNRAIRSISRGTKAFSRALDAANGQSVPSPSISQSQPRSPLHLKAGLNTTASRGLSSEFAQAERQGTGEAEAATQLEAYFPFDPYKLPRSGRWVKDDYIEYQGIPGLTRDKEEEEDDEEEEEEEEEGKGGKEEAGADGDDENEGGYVGEDSSESESSDSDASESDKDNITTPDEKTAR